MKVYTPPTPHPHPMFLCNTPPWFTQFASHSHSSILQHTWVHHGCNATHPGSLTTPCFLQTCNTLGFSLSLFATHCGSISSQYTWGSLHFQHTLVLLHYNTLVHPDLQHTGVFSLSATHCGSIGSQYTWGSLHSQHILVLSPYNRSWFSPLQLHCSSLFSQYTLVYSVHIAGSPHMQNTVVYNTPQCLQVCKAFWFTSVKHAVTQPEMYLDSLSDNTQWFSHHRQYILSQYGSLSLQFKLLHSSAVGPSSPRFKTSNFYICHFKPEWWRSQVHPTSTAQW